MQIEKADMIIYAACDTRTIVPELDFESYVYTNIDILGYTGSTVYIFNNHEENKNAKVITAYLTLKDESQTKCDKMMDDLQNYFENLFCDEPGFQVEVDEEVHRIGVEEPIEERLISTSVRVIRITQVNSIINVETYPKAWIVPISQVWQAVGG